MEESAHIIMRLRDEAKRKQAAALERADRAQRDAERHGVEADAYDKALKAMGAAEVAALDLNIDLDAAPRSGASDKWIGIYRALYESSDAPYGYDDIDAAVALAGHETSRGGQRTQMMNAVKAGIFARPSPGKFEFTDYGLQLIGLPPKQDAPPGSGGAYSGEVDASPEPAEQPGYQFRPKAADPAPRSGGKGG